jgi:hypothetical protein
MRNGGASVKAEGGGVHDPALRQSRRRKLFLESPIVWRRVRLVDSVSYQKAKPFVDSDVALAPKAVKELEKRR